MSLLATSEREFQPRSEPVSPHYLFTISSHHVCTSACGVRSPSRSPPSMHVVCYSPHRDGWAGHIVYVRPPESDLRATLPSQCARLFAYIRGVRLPRQFHMPSVSHILRALSGGA